MHERLPSGETRTLVYRGQRMVPHRRRSFGWFATVSHWEVETDRGPRAFTLKDPQENVRDLGPGRILLVDAHGNRYRIADVRQLDPASRKALEEVL